jgi:hypothetical protein
MFSYDVEKAIKLFGKYTKDKLGLDATIITSC